MKVLVTGANGFLGSHLVEELQRCNYDIKVLVREGSDLSALNADITKVTGDILNSESYINDLENLDAVFHVAGVMSSSPKDREKLFRVNVDGTQKLVNACIQKNVKKFIHVSSVVAVGASTDRSVLNEDSKNTTTEFGYANYDSKRQGEEVVLKAVRDGKLHATVVNPSLMYGERDAKKAMRKGNVRAAQGKLPFYTSGGVNIVAVEDVVHAMIKAVTKGRNGERYLLTGENVTIQELLTTISDMAGAKAPQKMLSDKLLWNLAKVHDFLRLKTELCRENCFAATAFHWYDSSKAKKELEFQPGPWKEAVLRSVQWMKANGLVEE